uniref:Uncharacterized protein n=1 Tax=Glossina pallidipes TaxID=7398 RepID=A0A1A9ZFG6_GLOPL
MKITSKFCPPTDGALALVVREQLIFIKGFIDSDEIQAFTERNELTISVMIVTELEKKICVIAQLKVHPKLYYQRAVYCYVWDLIVYGVKDHNALFRFSKLDVSFLSFLGGFAGITYGFASVTAIREKHALEQRINKCFKRTSRVSELTQLRGNSNSELTQHPNKKNPLNLTGLQHHQIPTVNVRTHHHTDNIEPLNSTRIVPCKSALKSLKHDIIFSYEMNNSSIVLVMPPIANILLGFECTCNSVRIVKINKTLLLLYSLQEAQKIVLYIGKRVKMFTLKEAYCGNSRDERNLTEGSVALCLS